MNGAEHKAAAEQMIAEYLAIRKRGTSLPAWMLAVAQVHATLSVEAAIRGEP